MKTIAFWFRRDLRIFDNHGLYQALTDAESVVPVFIFDTDIVDELPENDARISFIHEQLLLINDKLSLFNSSLLIRKGKPVEVWKGLIDEFGFDAIYTNRDYEPYGIDRDLDVASLCDVQGVSFKDFKDQVIFEKSEVIKGDGTPYTVFTPFKNKWLEHYEKLSPQGYNSENLGYKFAKLSLPFPTLGELGFQESAIKVRPYDLSVVRDYDRYRNFPSNDRGSYLGPHLRFGTVSIRQLVEIGKAENPVFLSELIWREFFMQILFHFPKVVESSFRSKYDKIEWLNDKDNFEAWKQGRTGYPMVDAGMRQLNETGYMHNRVRMVVASFLCKHLLVDWRWGESYFAEKLLDYELSSNNGNWQWAAGTGCDAAPYFRVFNPTEQQKKFDKDGQYVRKWVKDLNSFDYPQPIVEHKFARNRAIETYKQALS